MLSGALVLLKQKQSQHLLKQKHASKNTTIDLDNLHFH